jgi:hypothetical protein
MYLSLESNPLKDAGVAAVAGALHNLPLLRVSVLNCLCDDP